MKNLLYFFLALGLFSACASENSSEEPIEEESSEVMTDANSSTSTAARAANTTITLTPKEPGVEYPDATISSMDYSEGKFIFKIDKSTYKLGKQTPDASSTMCANSGEGQHIHLIVDNKPYAAKYESEFDYELPDGKHRVLAFLSRSYHESIKTKAAHKAVNATIKDGTMVNADPIDEMMLFYSRPKGTYVGKDTEKLLLDFYPIGVTLGANAKVKVETNGATFLVDKWQPYLLEGLPMGENTVTLSLVDGEGKLIKAPFNPVSRTFTLKADPLSE